jgi:ketopantoate reductase
MRIAIIGSGGVGGYFGGRLAQAGEDVVFVARGDHLQALRTRIYTGADYRSISAPVGGADGVKCW